jgi:hypothetical protein
VPVVLPEQVPVHWLLALTHLPLEQSPSATHRHAVWAELRTGVGESVVVHAVPPALVQAIEDGAATQPFEPAVPVPVQFDPQALMFAELATHWPLAHWSSLSQMQLPPAMPPLQVPVPQGTNVSQYPDEGPPTAWQPR